MFLTGISYISNNVSRKIINLFILTLSLICICSVIAMYFDNIIDSDKLNITGLRNSIICIVLWMGFGSSAIILDMMKIKKRFIIIVCSALHFSFSLPLILFFKLPINKLIIANHELYEYLWQYYTILIYLQFIYILYIALKSFIYIIKNDT